VSGVWVSESDVCVFVSMRLIRVMEIAIPSGARRHTLSIAAATCHTLQQQ